MNIDRTAPKSDTDSARACSPGVRTAALVNRRRVGAKTREGYRWSNIDEMLQNRETATGGALANLNYQIGIQVRDLARLTTTKAV